METLQLATLQKQGFDIFKIVGEPYPLECDGDEVEGCPEMPAGTVVCKGIYWNNNNNSTITKCLPNLGVIVKTGVNFLLVQ